jgi:glucose-fructose oxidoreductase
MTVGERTTRIRGRKHDQFAAELLYFSDCILRDRQPEPSGLEGLQDVAIVQALVESADTGRVVRIPERSSDATPRQDQRIVRPPVGKVKLVKARSAHKN